MALKKGGFHVGYHDHYAVDGGKARIILLERFRLRGLWKVNAEALLIATGQNLKRLLRKWGWGRQAPLARGARSHPLKWSPPLV